MFCFATTASAQVKLANIFGNNMVLQRNQRLSFWVTAPASERIFISMRGAENSTFAMGDHANVGLVAKGSALKRLEICGVNEKFVWVDATISGNNVIVSSDKVQAPVAVRYAWANNPEGCNSYNKEGLPHRRFAPTSSRALPSNDRLI